MKKKRGKILKVIPGVNPNCSAGMFVVNSIIYGTPVYLIASLVSAYLLRNRFEKVKDLAEAIKEAEMSKAVRQVKVISIALFVVLAAIIGSMMLNSSYLPPDVFGSLFLIFYVLLPVIFMAGGLIVVASIGKEMLQSNRPSLIYVIMPLITLNVVLLFILYGIFWRIF